LSRLARFERNARLPVNRRPVQSCKSILGRIPLRMIDDNYVKLRPSPC
jgi:hypothetical protein